MLKPYYADGFGTSNQNVLNYEVLGFHKESCLLSYSVRTIFDTLFSNHQVDNMLDKLATQRIALFDMNSKKMIKQKIFDDRGIIIQRNNRTGDILMFSGSTSGNSNNPFQYDELILNQDSSFNFTYIALYDKELNRKWIKTFDSAASFQGRVFMDDMSNVYYHEQIDVISYKNYRLSKIDNKGVKTNWELKIGKEGHYTELEFYSATFDALGNLYFSSATSDSAYYIGDSLILNNSFATSPSWGVPLKTDGFLAKISASEISRNLNVNQQKIITFPNPSYNSFSFFLDPKFYNDYPRLTVYNMNGAIIYREEDLDQMHNIDCSNWPKGLYQLQLKTQGEMVGGSIVVQ